MSLALGSVRHEAAPPPPGSPTPAARAHLPGEGLAEALMQPDQKLHLHGNPRPLTPGQGCGPHLSVGSPSASGGLGVQRRCPDLCGEGPWSVHGSRLTPPACALTRSLGPHVCTELLCTCHLLGDGHTEDKGAAPERPQGRRGAHSRTRAVSRAWGPRAAVQVMPRRWGGRQGDTCGRVPGLRAAWVPDTRHQLSGPSSPGASAGHPKAPVTGSPLGAPDPSAQRNKQEPQVNGLLALQAPRGPHWVVVVGGGREP